MISKCVVDVRGVVRVYSTYLYSDGSGAVLHLDSEWNTHWCDATVWSMCTVGDKSSKSVNKNATFHFAVILKFRSQYGRLPQTTTNTSEKEHLLTLRDEVMKQLNLDVTLLPDEFAR